MKKNNPLIILIITFFASPVFSAHPLTTDDAGTTQISRYELEFGYDNHGVPDIERNHSLNLSIKHGLTERIDIGVSFFYQIEPKQNERLGSANFGIKFAIIKELVAFSFNNIFGSSNYVLNSIFSNNIGEINLNLNLGYSATGQQDKKGNLTYASSIEYPLGKIDLLGEIFGNDNSQYWLVGIRYKFVEDIFVDSGYSKSFRDTSEKITFGLHYEF